MRVEVTDAGVHLFLSRRNLLALLAKLDGSPSWSACTVTAASPGGLTVAVTAEDDGEHYTHPSRKGEPAGLMHPDTEQAMAAEPPPTLLDLLGDG